MAREVVQVEGHIIDSLILAKVLDLIVEAGADYRIVDVDVGRSSVDPSRGPQVDLLMNNCHGGVGPSRVPGCWTAWRPDVKIVGQCSGTAEEWLSV